MAKQDDDDFGSDIPDGGIPGAGGGKPGLADRLPPFLRNAYEAASGAFSNVALSVRGAFADAERPWLPLALLGGVVALLLLLVLLMAGALGGSLAAKPAPRTAPAAAGAAEFDKSAAADKEAAGAARRDAGAGRAESPERPLVGIDPALDDGFLGNPILADEPAFMLQGEIHYRRPQKPYWDLADLRPGWQNLDLLYRRLLRERNSDDFHRLIGEAPPPRDRY